MRRRLALLLVAVSMFTATAILEPSPAAALPTGNACPVEGFMTLSSGIGLPNWAPVGLIWAPKRTVDFTFSWTLHTCLERSWSWQGTLTGWCGNSQARGLTSYGASFGWIELGTLLVLQGGIQGIGAMTPDETRGAANWCENGNATDFLLHVAAVEMDCDYINSKSKGALAPLRPYGDLQYKVHICV